MLAGILCSISLTSWPITLIFRLLSEHGFADCWSDRLLPCGQTVPAACPASCTRFPHRCHSDNAQSELVSLARRRRRDWAAGGCLLLCCAKHCGRHTTGLNRLNKRRILPMAGRPAADSRATHFTSGSHANTSCDYRGLPLLICVSIFLCKKWK